MKNVFITGVSGYIGNKIVQALSGNESVDHIVGIDIREPAVPKKNFTFIKRDVRENVFDILTAHDIDTVIHAAYVLPPGHDTKRIEEINVAGPGLDNPLSTHLKKPWVLLPKKTSPFQFVHEDDLVRVMLLCLENRLAGIYNVAGEGTISFDEMVKILGNTPLFLPGFLIRLLNGLGWHLRLTALTEFPNSGLNLMRHSWVASSEKLIRHTHFKFDYDSTAAFKDFAGAVSTRKKTG